MTRKELAALILCLWFVLVFCVLVGWPILVRDFRYVVDWWE